ncbi:MAG: aminoacyl-histidine dipeptidase [Calditrichaeota bacterium]|nr:MAG: aminoacyl-histidine dipeptidase [Calditrichota bacterium]
MTFVSELEPKALWQHFDKILTIPRGSKNEQQMGQYIISVAEKYGLSYKQDEVGNIVVSKPGTPGHESAPITILQSHLDMVTEKNADVEHDFTKDPIKPRREGDYLYATGTTLGSDNGIGVAAALALMEATDIEHGPLELLFTVDEETGLTGAGSLRSDFLQGRRLINLDTEEEGSLYVGCAGGAGINLTLKLKHTAAPANARALEVKLHGLRGGHSGVDIHLQRGNAIKLLARALTHVAKSTAFHLASVVGGNMHNAIPREAFAIAVVPEAARAGFEDALQTEFSAIQAEFKPADPEMQLSISETQADRVFDEETQTKVLNLLNALPHGVMSMSYDIPDLVETSSNLATVKTEDDQMVIHVSNRSSVASAIQAIQERVASMGVLAGAEVEELEGYPGWKPNMDSHVLKVAKEVHKDVLGKEPEIKAVHAGLECGIIGEKFPGMDMVSLGPQIEFPHSPDERVRIGSVADFYKLLQGILARLAQDK